MIKTSLLILSWILFLYPLILKDFRIDMDRYTLDYCSGLWYISYVISSAILIRLDEKKEYFYYVN